MRDAAIEWLHRLRSIEWKGNKKLTVFIVCVVLASAFWLLNALTKNYEITVPVPIAYSNLPADRVILNQLPKQLFFTLEGDGFSLIGVNEDDDFDTINADLEQVEWYTGEAEKQNGVLNTQIVRDELIRSVGSNIKVLDISRDSITIATDLLESKRVRVELAWNRNVPVGYTFKTNPRLLVDSIELFGPNSLLTSTTAVKTEPLEVRPKEGEQNVELSLALTSDKLRTEVPTIPCLYELEPLTEMSLDVPLTIRNLPDSIDLKLYPQKITVNGSVGLSRYETTTKSDLEAYVDAREIEKRPIRINVYVNARDNAVQIKSVNPERVEYIIRKK